MWNRDFDEDFETMDEEWERLQKERVAEISWKIENRISDEDLERGPIAYDAITGEPIYENGGCYNPYTDD